MTFDLDLWPTDLNINRGHLLIKDYLPTKFEASGGKRSWVISCTRWRNLAWPLTLTFDLLTWKSIGVIYSPRTIYLPSLKLLGQSVIELSVAQGKGLPSYRPTYRPTDRPTYRHTDRQVQSNMPSFFKGGHKYFLHVHVYCWIRMIVHETLMIHVLWSKFWKTSISTCKPVNQVNHTSWVAVVTPTDRP